MAQVKINDLSAASSVTSSMQLETDTGGTTAEKITIAQIESYLGVAVSNGATLPASPTTGEFFLHTPTGRTWLMQYDGSEWRVISQYGDADIYVEPDATGSQDFDEGTSTSDEWSFEWISTRLPTVINGDLNIHCSAGDYTSDEINIRGIIPSGALNIWGERNEVYASKTYSSIDGANHVVTFTSSVSSAALGDFVRLTTEYTGGSDWSRYLGQFFTTEQACVFPVLSSSGSTITIAGRDDGAFDDLNGLGSSTWTIYNLTSNFDSGKFNIANCANVRLYDLYFEINATVQWRGSNVNNVIVSGCEFEVTGSNSNMRLEPYDGYSVSFFGCWFHNETVVGSTSQNAAIFRCVGALNPDFVFFNHIRNSETFSSSGAEAALFQGPNRALIMGNHFNSQNTGADCVQVTRGYAYFGFHTQHYNYFTGTSGNYGVRVLNQGFASNISGRGVTSGLAGLVTTDSSTYGLSS